MSVENIPHVLYLVSIWVVPALIAITFHEAAHGYLAWRLGDDTAFRMCRVTFNPLKHIDGFGTIVLPALLLLLRAPFIFGWAKPVPVNFARLRNPRRDMVLVAAAGPATNLALAIAAITITLMPVLEANAKGPLIEETIAGAITERYANPGKILPVAAVADANALLNVLPVRSGLTVVRI